MWGTMHNANLGRRISFSTKIQKLKVSYESK